MSAGLFVPETAVQVNNNANYVAIARERGDGEQVEHVNVEIGQAVGSLRQIRPLADGELAEGVKVIVSGAHYVADGENVRAVEELTVSKTRQRQRDESP